MELEGCINLFRFPASLSLHSVEMIPFDDNHPGYCSITLRLPNEIRVVHGTPEIKDFILQILKEFTGVNKILEKCNGEVWILFTDSELFNSPSQLLVLSCQLLEGLITHGWEILTSSELSTTPSFELITWILKKSSTPPLYNAQVSCVYFESDNKIRILSSQRTIVVNNVVQRSIQTCWPKGLLCDSTNVPLPLKTPYKQQELLEQIESELEKSRESFVSDSCSSTPRKTRKFQSLDDPDAPSVFELWGSPWRPSNDAERIQARSLILDIISNLFIRQWKTITNAYLIRGSSCNNDVIFFCQDGRILPFLGQTNFLLIELQKPNWIRVHNASESLISSITQSVSENWPSGIKDAQPFESFEHVFQIEVNEDSWTQESQGLINNLLAVCSQNDFKHYFTLHLNRQTTTPSSVLLFKSSNISFHESLCLHLSGQNKMYLMGGEESEIEVVRRVIESRWPYPILSDISIRPQKHLFKVKRSPWTVSYGFKMVDKVFGVLKDVVKGVSLPSPQNTDTDSGKSLILITIKELNNLGWKVITSTDICSENTTTRNRNKTSVTRSPYSIYLMR